MNTYVQVSALDSALKARLRAALANRPVTFADEIPAADRPAAVAAGEIVFGNPPVAWLAAAAKLRWLQLDSAGVNAYLGINAGRAQAVTVTNLRDFYSWPVAEAVLAGMLAHCRRLAPLALAQPARRWIKREIEPQIGRLHGARVLILGAGAIGRRLAALLAPFEGEARFYARSSPLAQAKTLAELDAELARADVVVNTLPETSATIGLLDRGRLGRLPPHALLVNVGRGSAVDETALLAQLDAGKLAGAVLDVTAIEPLPPENPLWSNPRVILTQHTGGRFPGEAAGKVEHFLQNYARFARGEPLPGAVDLSRGY